ncbi:MAG: metallophosphoesterase [Bacteroides intestinalis]|nr:metallophosphoesterase [Bacteroides intestinalis]
MKKKLILLFLWMCIFPVLLSAQSRFAFKDGKFVIAQFTDLHWTPESPKCVETAATIRAILESEHPDLAVLSGDVVTAAPAIDGWKAVAEIFNEAKIPFVATTGNHDAEYLTRDEIYDILLKYPYYVGSKGPKEIGGGNCVIPVYASKEKNKVAASLYCMDSNDYQPNKLYGAYDWIHFNQIEWYRKQSLSFTVGNGGIPVPSLAFFIFR